MQPKHTAHHECPVARCVDQIGDWWCILILRDALQGSTRFDEFQRSLGIAPTILTRRLKGLVHDGLMERSQYCEHPPRDEYLLTRKGLDFQPVLYALLAWGNKHFSPDGVTLMIHNDRTNKIVEPILVDKESGEPIVGPDFRLACGPAASDEMKKKLHERRLR